MVAPCFLADLQALQDAALPLWVAAGVPPCGVWANRAALRLWHAPSVGELPEQACIGRPGAGAAPSGPSEAPQGVPAEDHSPAGCWRDPQGRWWQLHDCGEVSQGDTPARLWAAFDVSAWQERLEASHRALESARQSKFGFLANMSHELRTPLNGVLGMSELLLHTPLSPNQREFVELVHASGRALLCIVNDILDYAKIEAHRLVPERREFDLQEVLDDALQPFHAQARQKGIRLVLDAASGVPPRLLGDPQRIRRVLSNLVAHALARTAVGEVRITAQWDGAPGPRAPRGASPPALVVTVADTGAGMTSEECQAIFEPFAGPLPAGVAGRRPTGSGLGLAIVRQLVELMGGQIEVESAPGYGSTFRCTLPCEAVPAAPSPSAAAPTGPQAWPQLRGKRVLLAEDNPLNQMLTVAMVEALGAECIVVGNGQEALERVAAGGLDVVLMDVQMPVMGGLEATEAIRRQEAATPGAPRLPIIAMTAHAMQDDRARCLAAGMDGYLAKPVGLQAVAEALADALRLRQP